MTTAGSRSQDATVDDGASTSGRGWSLLRTRLGASTARTVEPQVFRRNHRSRGRAAYRRPPGGDV